MISFLKNLNTECSYLMFSQDTFSNLHLRLNNTRLIVGNTPLFIEIAIKK